MGKVASPKKKPKRVTPYESQTQVMLALQEDSTDEPTPKGFLFISPSTLKLRKVAADRAKKLKFQSEPNFLKPKQRTPLKRGLALRRLLNAPFFHRDVDDIIADELRGGNIVEEDPKVMLSRIFPAYELPDSIDYIYEHLKKKGLIVEGSRAFPFAPTLTGTNLSVNTDERNFSKFLNDLCKEAKVCFRKTPHGYRIFTGKFSSLPLMPFEVSMNRKPDILLVDYDILLDDEDRDGERLRWIVIIGSGELKSFPITDPETFMRVVAREVQDKGFCIFEAQDDRRYVVSWSCTERLVRISLLDQSTVLHSLAFDYQRNPKVFLHLIIGLAFASEKALGFDSTMRMNRKLERVVDVGTKECILKHLIWRSPMIRGRATSVYFALVDGEELIMKDSWPLDSRKPSEVYYLQIAKKVGVRNIPELVDWEDVKFNGKVDSTNNIHGVYKQFPNRTHRRLLLRGSGVSIWYFANRNELMLGFIDHVDAHDDLFVKAKILHADISVTNLLLRNRKSVPRGGLLIDNDYSVDLEPESQIGYDDEVQGRYPEGYERPVKVVHEDEVVGEGAVVNEGKVVGEGEVVNEGKVVDEGEVVNENKVVDQGEVVNEEKAVDKGEVVNESEIADESKVVDESTKKPQTEDEETPIRGPRTGTHAFMAADLLINLSRKPEVHYDLESFFYIMMYMGCMYKGPNNDQVPFKDMPDFLREWFEQKDSSQLGLAKNGMLHLRDEDFIDKFLSHFQDYFDFLKPCMLEMKHALQDPERTLVTHAHWRKLLNDAITLIPPERAPRFAPPVAEQNRELYELSDRMDFYDASTFIRRQQLRLKGDAPGIRSLPGVVTDDGVGFFYRDLAKENEEAQAAATTSANERVSISTFDLAGEQATKGAPPKGPAARFAPNNKKYSKYRGGSENALKLPALRIISEDDQVESDDNAPIADTNNTATLCEKTAATIEGKEPSDLGPKSSTPKINTVDLDEQRKSNIKWAEFRTADAKAKNTPSTIKGKEPSKTIPEGIQSHNEGTSVNKEKESRDMGGATNDEDSSETGSIMSETPTAVEGTSASKYRSKIPRPQRAMSLSTDVEVDETQDQGPSSSIKLSTSTELSTANNRSKQGSSKVKVSTVAQVTSKTKNAPSKPPKSSATGRKVSADSGPSHTDNVKISSTAEVIRNNAAIERAKRNERRNAKRDARPVSSD